MLINISPRLWGESFWKMMHFVTLSYPDSNQNISEQDKTHVKDFFLSVKNVLPCENCRLHFEQNLEKFPLNDNILSSKDNLIKWLVDIHNEVNIRTGKSTMTVSQVMKKYTEIPEDKEIDWKTLYTIGLLILLIIIFIYFARY
jgi:hypothetical protein